jgi:hypothetical protein
MADLIAEWNSRAGEWLAAAHVAPAPARRLFAVLQTAVYGAVNAVTQRYPAGGMEPGSAQGASIDAAVAATHRAVLVALLPSQQAAITSAVQAALAKVPEGAARNAGIAVGEKSAAALLAIRADDLLDAPDSYRPVTTAGVYVPTALPVASNWGRRTPWQMPAAAQFRPDPPPAMNTPQWARDYNEVKNFGGRDSKRRTPAQTAIARFWEDNTATIYYGLVRTLSGQANRDATQNARLFMAVAQAADDATIAVFEAKYHYNFWRPLTAIRNGDLDAHEYTERDASWLPLIETPLHPEYPCAHCANAAAVGAVLKAEVAGGSMPPLSTRSTTAEGERSWKSVEEIVREVSDARVFGGVHFRNSADVGAMMGRKNGELVASALLVEAK